MCYHYTHTDVEKHTHTHTHTHTHEDETARYHSRVREILIRRKVLPMLHLFCLVNILTSMLFTFDGDT